MSRVDLGLHGRVFVLTGGSRGSASPARVLVAEGARVVLSGRDAETVAQPPPSPDAVQALGVEADLPTRLGRARRGAALARSAASTAPWSASAGRPRARRSSG